MSRNICGKIVVKGECEALTPIAVGGAGGGDHVDLELAEDTAGRLCIPGTSLAGPMRSWLMRRADSDASDENSVISQLFGFIHEKSDTGTVSRLYIADSIISSSVRERRHGVSILLQSGTAKERFLYTRAMLPRGTKFPLQIELDMLGGKEQDNSRIAASALKCMLKALISGKIRFGGGKTRGMGHIRLNDTRICLYDFNSASDLDRWLDSKQAERSGGIEILDNFADLDELCNDGDDAEIIVSWCAKSPLMVKAGREGIAVKMIPLMSGTGGSAVAPVIPGSSVKGVLRTQAERILNTIFRRNTPNDGWNIINDIFGSASQAGRLLIDDVYYEKQIERKEWLNEYEINNDGTKNHVEEQWNKVTDERSHVAIDRFTGGTSNSALYSARPVRKDGGWDPIRLIFRKPKDETRANEELALISLLLRDMREGYIAFGFGTRRGLGDISIIDIQGMPSDASLQDAWHGFIRREKESIGNE